MSFSSRVKEEKRDAPVVVRQWRDVDQRMECENHEEEGPEVVKLFDKEVPREGDRRGKIGDSEAVNIVRQCRQVRTLVEEEGRREEGEKGRKGRGDTTHITPYAPPTQSHPPVSHLLSATSVA
jgi:hypothetical protein